MGQKIPQMPSLLNMENYLRMEDHTIEFEMDLCREPNPKGLLLVLNVRKQCDKFIFACHVKHFLLVLP